MKPHTHGKQQPFTNCETPCGDNAEYITHVHHTQIFIIKRKEQIRIGNLIAETMFWVVSPD